MKVFVPRESKEEIAAVEWVSLAEGTTELNVEKGGSFLSNF